MPNTAQGDQKGVKSRPMEDLHTTFIRNVEHELRTPVAIVQGYAELLSEGALGTLAPEQEQAVFAITNNTHKLRTVVERIGTLLAVKSEILTPMPLNLADVVTGVVESRWAEATRAELTLSIKLASNLPPIAGYPYHLQQAVDCLVENAIKFTPAGGRVEVRLEEEAGWVDLTIADTGIGIAEDKLAYIFNTFYQVDGSTTRSYGGLGLGLGVVKAIVEAYSGQVEVESHLGQGSRFTLKFPALSSTTQLEKEHSMSLDGQTKSQRILIVDDEEFVAMTLQEGLEKLPNCEVTTTTSGQKALQLFEQKPYDLLFVDYKIPDLDGISLATRIRQICPQTVIIMITGYADRKLQEQAAGVSIERVLNKPVELDEVRHLASAALNQTEKDH